MAEKFKILAADKLAQEGLDYVRSQPDAQLTDKPGLTEDELAAIVGEYDGLIVRSGVQVSAKVLENSGRLKAIARAGVGVDNIDLQAATAKGILVMNTAQASTITTAEHAFALMMALVRNIGPAYKTMSQGGWDRSKFQGVQLSGKTLGVIGFGRIGQTVAMRALAFDMQVVAYDPFFNAATALDGKVKMYKQVADLLPMADILTFHVPLNDQTRGMLNQETFELCREGVLVVNASRGGVVDEEAVLEAVESGRCGGAALDVFTTEPLPADSPLRSHRRILVTPHLGASTVEAQRAVSVDAAASVLTYLRGEGIQGAVNAGGMRMDLDPVQERFVRLAQRMASLISALATGGIAAVTVECCGKDIVGAAGMIERVSLIGLLAGHLDVPLNRVNVRHVAEQRGIKLKTITSEENKLEGSQLVIEIEGGGQSHRVVGRVYHDMRPRVVEIDGYHMDIVPAGVMMMILNQDRPGMVGLVGDELGQEQVNIADMAISRRDDTALMVIKVDGEASESLLNRLRHRPGMLQVVTVKLPAEDEAVQV